jgi:hypothetical protein
MSTDTDTSPSNFILSASPLRGNNNAGQSNGSINPIIGEGNSTSGPISDIRTAVPLPENMTSTVNGGGAGVAGTPSGLTTHSTARTNDESPSAFRLANYLDPESSNREEQLAENIGRASKVPQHDDPSKLKFANMPSAIVMLISVNLCILSEFEARRLVEE